MNLGSFWGEFGVILGEFGPFLVNLGSFWGEFGVILGEFGAILGQFGVILGEFGVILGEFGVLFCVSGSFWGELGPFWGCRDADGGVVARNLRQPPIPLPSLPHISTRRAAPPRATVCPISGPLPHK